LSGCSRWGLSSVALELREQQYAELGERGKGWPWNGYELRLMKKAGKYPPQPLARPLMTAAVVWCILTIVNER
jgi:hypothetical protein